MTDQSRRDVILKTGALAALLGFGLETRAFAGSPGEALASMVESVDGLTAGLRGQDMSVSAWRERLDAVFAHVDLADILAALDFDRLRANTGYAERGVATAGLRLTASDGQHMAFFPQLFAVGRSRAIIPHAHANMVSAHLILSGRFHLRQYDRVAVEDDAVLIRPSVDRMVSAGDLASIGDPDDNVHWFVAEENAHTLDVVVTGLDASAPVAFDIYNIDPDAAVAVDNDVWRAPRLTVSDAMAKYG